MCLPIQSLDERIHPRDHGRGIRDDHRIGALVRDDPASTWRRERHQGNGYGIGARVIDPEDPCFGLQCITGKQAFQHVHDQDSLGLHVPSEALRGQNRVQGDIPLLITDVDSPDHDFRHSCTRHD